MNGNKLKGYEFYINEIIRINYKCNWACKFCNVIKTNNFGDNDISDKEVIYQILNLAKKYTKEHRNKLVLSFSGGEPTLNKNLLNYIRLANKIGIKRVEIQTNGTKLFKDKKYIFDLINAGLSEIFLAQHSGDKEINKELGCFYNIEDFKDWVDFILFNKINDRIKIFLNIVITKINIFSLYDYIKFLIGIGFLDLMPKNTNLINDFNEIDYGKTSSKISFGFIQPNGYAQINSEKVLLEFNELEVKEIERIILLCKENNILPDFHFVSPPICILNYPEYNLEYLRLKNLEFDVNNGTVKESNLKKYDVVKKEKRKLDECNKCHNNKYCLGFYNYWVDYFGEEYVKGKIENYLEKYN